MNGVNGVWFLEVGVFGLDVMYQLFSVSLIVVVIDDDIYVQFDGEYVIDCCFEFIVGCCDQCNFCICYDFEKGRF